MKILITGANGQLGRELTKQYKEKGNVELILTDVDTLDITNVNDHTLNLTFNSNNTTLQENRL